MTRSLADARNDAARTAGRWRESARVSGTHVGVRFGSMIMHCLALMRADNAEARSRYRYEPLASGRRAANLAGAVMRELR